MYFWSKNGRHYRDENCLKYLVDLVLTVKDNYGIIFLVEIIDLNFEEEISCRSIV